MKADTMYNAISDMSSMLDVSGMAVQERNRPVHLPAWRTEIAKLTSKNVRRHCYEVQRTQEMCPDVDGIIVQHKHAGKTLLCR